MHQSINNRDNTGRIGEHLIPITEGFIGTFNQPFNQWDQVFPDALMTVAAIDRIIHHATILEIDLESFRRKNRKGNPVQTLAAASPDKK